jgi:hypothetical protein
MFGCASPVMRVRMRSCHPNAHRPRLVRRALRATASPSFGSSECELATEQMNRDGYDLVWAGPLISPSPGEYYIPIDACSFLLDTLVVEVCGDS